MPKLRSIILSCFAVFAVLACLGKADIEWLGRTFDFGAFQEDKGKRDGEFRFVNRGTRPVSILQVKTSCGCTTARYPREAVAPGDTAAVKFAYDPYRRPGRFEKSIKVFTAEALPPDSALQGGVSAPEVLTIKGLVMASDSTLAEYYPVKVGDGVHLSGRMVNLGEIKPGVSRHGFLQIYNTGPELTQPQIKTGSKALAVKMMPDTIGTGENGIISVCLDTSKEKRKGDVEYPVELKLPGEGESVTLTVWATMMP